jgi:flagellar protein FliS
MYGDPRTAYLQSAVETASPVRLLMMLVDRLELDVQRGLEAQHSADFESAHGHLVHAQDILIELACTLHADAFSGGPGLAQLYSWLHGQLVRANIDRDAQVTAECLPLVGQIAQMWREAALQSTAVVQ